MGENYAVANHSCIRAQILLVMGLKLSMLFTTKALVVKWLRSRPPIWIDGGPSSNLGWRTYSDFLFCFCIVSMFFLLLLFVNYADVGIE